ncbi:HAMP domain-containing histidine kinase [Ruminococcus sp. OA3]|uniref:sensor histidine kinase n=1 Tax=Ruminococcus sp. OA3 TaxID=2914164 RepID=UPI001F062F15|nr:HAMP domain-containing sensor histidine kinase [Ruminococcus sp. OA3]MCH1983374.1 HAMP domain-containing histidine kinase [Ruminococcus sp. OA3]
MKKYNAIMICSIVFCLLISMIAGYGIVHMKPDRDERYKVEINRIYHSLQNGSSPESIDLNEYRYVDNITYLSAAELQEKNGADDFFLEENHSGISIRPAYYEDKLEGFWRFDYRRPSIHTGEILLLTELCFGVMGLFFVILLFYLKSQLINPFLRIKNLPYDLAKGHLSGIVTEEKSRFFGDFLWGIGLLKDTLQTSKKRQLELEREKKKMLLSLSHDIKTPLHMIRLYGKTLEEEMYRDDSQKTHAAHQIGEKAAEIEQYVEEIMKNSREDILDIQVNDGEFYQDDLIRRLRDTYEEKCRMRMIDLKIGQYENLLLKGDLERSLEVLGNIMENAFKYGDGRRIEISFHEEDYCHLIRIYNTGEPVTDHEFNHIFESFFRGGNSGGQEGSGLGLYICMEIMRRMSGAVFAEKDDSGMAFVLVFR